MTFVIVQRYFQRLSFGERQLRLLLERAIAKSTLHSQTCGNRGQRVVLLILQLSTLESVGIDLRQILGANIALDEALLRDDVSQQGNVIRHT